MATNEDRTDCPPGQDTAPTGTFHGTRRIQIDPFFQVPLYSQDFSRGEVQLPILVQDGNALYCQFFAPRDRVSELLQNKPLDPAFVFGKKALVGLVVYEHLQTTVGRYTNMNLVIPVNRQTGFKRPSSWQEIRMNGDRRHMGFHVTDSTLNNPVMLAAGREIWGYPKSLAQLSARFDGARIHAECNDFDGRHGIARLVGYGPRLMRFPSLELTMFTFKGNELLRSLINTRGHFQLHWPFGFRLQVGDSRHPLAERLRFLGLDNARPFAVFSCTDYQARMNAGVTVDILMG